MERTVKGFCLKTDGGVSYLACPFCYAHLCPSYHQFQASNNYNKLMIDVDSGGSSSSGSEQLLDEDFLYNCLRSIAGQPYRQLNITSDMWVACSSFKELELVRISGRPFGRIGDFNRLAEELAWDVPAGLVVANVDKERALLFKSGEEPIPISAYSALCYLRRWTAGGLMLFGNGNIGFLETHYQPGAMHTTIRRMLRLTVESWVE